MINLLRYWKHLLHAKGRHGTHSPFVYSFVEQVLRNKSRIKVHQIDPYEKSALSRSEINLLYKIIAFLKPAIILADMDLINLLDQIRALSEWNDIVILELNEGNIKKEEGDVLVISRNDRNENIVLQQLIKQYVVALLLIKPNGSSASQEAWKLLCGLPGVNMRLDFWHFGLLLNHPGFKASQYFKLR